MELAFLPSPASLQDRETVENVFLCLRLFLFLPPDVHCLSRHTYCPPPLALTVLPQGTGEKQFSTWDLETDCKGLNAGSICAVQAFSVCPELSQF